MGKTLGSLADLANEEPTPEARVPAIGASQRPVPLDQIAFNPRNKRNVYAHPGKIEEMGESLLTIGQISPCAAVTRADYLKIFPEDVSKVGDATYVQCPGARRLAAARLKGIPTLDIIVKPKLATDRATWLAATTMENTDREDLDPIEEALQVQELVAELKQSKLAAEKLGKEPAWVTTRTNWLKLSDDVQRMLSTGEVSRRNVRDIHGIPFEQQMIVVRLRCGGDPGPISAELATMLREQFPDLEDALGPRPQPSPGTTESNPAPVRRRGRPLAVVSTWRRLGDPREVAKKVWRELPADEVETMIRDYTALIEALRSTSARAGE